MGIEIDDRTEDEILGDRLFESEAMIIQEETKATRPSPKSDTVLRHDLAQFAVIKDERKKNPKTWLLTADRSLVRTASRLTPKTAPPLAAAAAAGRMGATSASSAADSKSALDIPYCFSLAGFLQSISPFTASIGEENSLADIFSDLVTDYLSFYENLFDMREMNLLMEWHEDVMITPPEQLIPALDYVKTKVLEGRHYAVADLPRVALELKKFLSKSVEERQRALEIEAERRAAEVRKEQQARADIEAQLKRERELRSQEAREEQQRREDQIARVTVKQWRERLIVGLCLSAALWFMQDNLTTTILANRLDPLRWKTPVQSLIVLSAGLFLVIPTIFFVRAVQWRRESKAFTIAVLFLLLISVSRLVGDDAWSKWASRIEVAVFLSGIVYLIATRVKPDPNSSE